MLKEKIENIRQLHKVNQVLKIGYVSYMITSSGLVFAKPSNYKSSDIGLAYSTLTPESYMHLFGLGLESHEIMIVFPTHLYRSTQTKRDIVNVYTEMRGSAKALRVVSTKDFSLKSLSPETYTINKDGSIDIIVGIIVDREKVMDKNMERMMNDLRRVSFPDTLYENHGFRYFNAEEDESITSKISDRGGIAKISYDDMSMKITSSQLPFGANTRFLYRFTRSESAPTTFVAHYILIKEHIINHFIYQVMDLDLEVL